MSYLSTKIPHIFDPDAACWCCPKKTLREVPILTDEGHTFCFVDQEFWFHFEQGSLPRGHKRHPRKPNMRILGA